MQGGPFSTRREGNLIAAADGAFQYLRIGCRGTGLQGRQAADLAQERVQVAGRLGDGPGKPRLFLSFILDGDKEAPALF